MCGIVGYVGPRSASPILLNGLKKLEYRGYDSAGVAIHDGQQLQLVRTLGKLENLESALRERPLSGSLGLGHTRWATHGRPSEANAHPHVVDGIAVVHNGIIENHLILKQRLIEDGAVFSSDTDTEIVAHLVARARRHVSSLVEAVKEALKAVEGAYALGVISGGDPERIVIAKNASPLVVGIGDGEMLCGSDIPALLAATRSMLFLEDGEIAELTREACKIQTLDGKSVSRQPKRIDWSPMQAEKAGFKHFMLKEIFEQPRAVEDTVRGRVLLEEADLVDAELGLTPEVARSIDRVVLVACGTSYHASLCGRYWIEQIARLPAHAELGSEVRYRDPVFTPRDLVVAVSQSGETADTLAALKSAKDAGAKVLAVCNVLDSAIPRAADGALYTHAGPEIGVASTKCFTTQQVALLLLAVYLGRRRGSCSEETARELLQQLVELPNAMRTVLEQKDEVYRVARKWQHADHMLFLGRGPLFPVALEGALKLKEISYAHAEGYAAGEMKHGPIALIDESMPVVVLAPKNKHYDKTLSNLQEVRARDGQVIALLTEGDDEVREVSQFCLELPNLAEVVQPIAAIIPLQLLSYFIADLKGTDVDQPRNLAKTVTVE